MFPNNMQVLGRERDNERYQEAEHLRLIKIAQGEQPGSGLIVRTAISWLGSQMVRLGTKLQAYGRVSLPMQAQLSNSDNG
jgi:hypothetical protein